MINNKRRDKKMVKTLKMSKIKGKSLKMMMHKILILRKEIKMIKTKIKTRKFQNHRFLIKKMNYQMNKPKNLKNNLQNKLKKKKN